MEDKESPFRPGTPAPPELFVGRQKEINQVTRYINQASHGKQEHAFLIGDRGIGKSSLAAYVMNYAKKKNKMIGIHLFLDGKSNINMVVKDIVEKLLNETSEEKWYDKIKNIFEEHVESVGYGGLNINFNPPKKDLTDLTKNFPQILKKITDEIKDEKNGIFIILDDINGLTHDPEFANWYKSFVDTVATTYIDDFPIFILLVGLPEKREALFAQNESFMRIFHVTEINRLKDTEITEFFKNTFSKLGITVEKEALNLMVGFSSGLPTMMHEIGDAVFWVDEDKKISQEDAIYGVYNAGENIGEKYLRPTIYGSRIRSKTYQSILKKIGDNKLAEFSKEELESYLDPTEKKRLNDFIRRYQELNIIMPKDTETNTYKFCNNLYPIYILIESLKEEYSKKD
jgi:hypothetical protein